MIQPFPVAFELSVLVFYRCMEPIHWRGVDGVHWAAKQCSWPPWQRCSWPARSRALNRSLLRQLRLHFHRCVTLLTFEKHILLTCELNSVRREGSAANQSWCISLIIIAELLATAT